MNTYEIWAEGHENAGGYCEPELLGIVEALDENFAIFNFACIDSRLDWIECWQKYKFGLRNVTAKKI